MNLPREVMQRRLAGAIRRIGERQFPDTPNAAAGRADGDEFGSGHGFSILGGFEQQRQHGLEQNDGADDVDGIVLQHIGWAHVLDVGECCLDACVGYDDV